jgi:hypothetical protein
VAKAGAFAALIRILGTRVVLPMEEMAARARADAGGQSVAVIVPVSRTARPLASRSVTRPLQ